MHSEEILSLALEMAGIDETPADTMIYVPGEMKRILFGIDIDLADVMMAKELGYDGVIGHHPIGLTTRTNFYQVMNRQKQLMMEVGASEEEAEEALKERRGEKEYGGMNVNYDRHVTSFRMLGLPVMNLHIVIDIITEKTARERIYPQFPEGNDKTVGDLIDAFLEFPEYTVSLVKPRIMIGEAENPCGELMIALANGTFGGREVLRTYWRHGRDTVVYMHVPEKDVKVLLKDKEPKNLVVAGHMPGDSIGINVFIDELIKRGMEVDTFSGIARS